MEELRAKRADFEAAALKSLVGKSWGFRASFVCPLCGGNAKAFRLPVNGKLLAECEWCKYEIVEGSRIELVEVG